MRIVHMTTVHRRYDTRIFLKMCRSLASAGHEVHLVVSDNEQPREERHEHVWIHAVPRPRTRWMRMWRAVDSVLRAAEELRGDLYHFHDPEFLRRGPAFQQRVAAPLVYDAHEDIRAQVLYKEWLPRHVRRPVSWLVGRVEDRASRAVAGIVTATPSIAERFEDCRHCVTINNYPLSDELGPQTPQRGNETPGRFVYVGGIGLVRAACEMISALPLAGPQARLALGGNWETQSLRATCTALAGWAQVEELGHLGRPAMRRTLESAQAGLVLFHPHPNHLRAQPNKMFEYMSASLPVIASDFPLWRSIIEPAGCGLLVDPLDTGAIARAMRWMMGHPDEARAMGQRGRRAVLERYNWEREFPKLLEFYDVLPGQPSLSSAGRQARPRAKPAAA